MLSERRVRRRPLNTPHRPEGQRVAAYVPEQLTAAMDVWIAGHAEPRPGRSDAVRNALQEWLAGLGLLQRDITNQSRRSG
jgi:hypothetical protein